MSPLDTFDKAKAWAHNRAQTFSKDGMKSYFVVCPYNEGYIVHDIKHIYSHINEYLSEEILYCTNEDEFKQIIITIRFIQNGRK